ncbi:hypothetical protein [Nesterenkonia natronophila]|jgi:hypothetical protein|uniref:hypothetical protein n=1 Tax=Nesterenkonia natronophila TaxID=2174932 RepID=UPI00131475BE|nr:hypothetical protein [Nesterenkonia natronophila]
MYGSDQSQVAALAATGTVLGVGWHFIAFGVLIMAGLTMVTIASVLHHRARGER